MMGNLLTVLGAVSNNPKGKLLAWEFLKENWDEFNERYGHGGFMLMRLVGLPGGFTTQDQLDDVRRFYGSNPVPAAERSVRQVIEGVELNVSWLAKNKDDASNWLSRH